MFLKNPLPKYGFPFVCVDKWEFPLGDGFMVHYYPWLICVDILVAVVILASLWFALERWITWRKPSTS